MQTIKRLFGYIRYYWRIFLFANLILIVSVVLNMLLPRIAQYIIDDILLPVEHTGLIPWSLIQQALLFYMGIGISASLLNYIASYFMVKSSNRFTQQLRNDVYAHIHRMPIQFFDTVPAGTIVSRITNDTETIRQNFYINIFSDALVAFARIVGIFVAIAIIRWEIALALLVLIPGVYFFQKIYTKNASGYMAELRELHGQINGRINEITKNVQMTQSYGKEAKVMGDFEKLTQDQWLISDKFNRFDWMMFNIPENVIRMMMISAVVWLVYSHLQLNLPVSPGELYAIINYITNLFWPITMILDVLAQIVRSIVSANRVFEILDRPIEDDGDIELSHVEGSMALQDVSFEYVDNQPVLKGVDFQAMRGQTIAIVGPTGSGKSSMLNLLFRFYDPQEGLVLLDGVDIRRIRRKSLREQMGIVLQEPFLFEGSVYTNISLNNKEISRELAEEALLKVGGSSFFEHGRKGLDEEITERGKNLSNGQRQLISFARALAYQPKILILDEATASIDTETEQVIQQAMDVVKKGRTTIIIAHRLSTIRDADAIYVLKAGKVVEKGRHEELLGLDGEYASMVRLQNSL